MPKCRDNRRRRLKRSRREQRRLVARDIAVVRAGILEHLPATLAEVGATLMEAMQWVAATVRSFMLAIEPALELATRTLREYQRRREEELGPPEPIDVDVLRQLLGAPTDGASEVALFTAEGGIQG